MERTILQWSVLSLKALKEKAIHNRGPFLEKIEMSSPLGLHALTWLTLSLLMILPSGPTLGASSQVTGWLQGQDVARMKLTSSTRI